MRIARQTLIWRGWFWWREWQRSTTPRFYDFKCGPFAFWYARKARSRPRIK